jgi:hypothetical protein
MINTSALLSTFKPDTLANQKTQVEYRKWQAAFYSNRTLMWQASKGKIFKDAIANGSISPIAPGHRNSDGSYSRPEFDEDDIKDLYSEAWSEFTDQYDEAFVHATIDEIGEYSQSHFGESLKDLISLNDRRSAEKFSR